METVTICNSHRRENGGATCDDCPLCAAETERAAIVAWFRMVRSNQDYWQLGPRAVDAIATAIERGEHLKGGK